MPYCSVHCIVVHCIVVTVPVMSPSPLLALSLHPSLSCGTPHCIIQYSASSYPVQYCISPLSLSLSDVMQCHSHTVAAWLTTTHPTTVGNYNCECLNLFLGNEPYSAPTLAILDTVSYPQPSSSRPSRTMVIEATRINAT